MTPTTSSAIGSLEHLDPGTLTIDPNVRTLAEADAGMVESVRQHGVLTPILAWRDPDGVVHVRAGQRRTLAAQTAGIPTVPVYLVDASDADTAARIVQQLVENDHREHFTEGDRVQAWKALELEGLSVAVIAKRTGTKRDRVKTGLTVAANPTATTLVTAGGVTLDQAAIMIEFDDDPHTLTELTRIATTDPDYFPVAVERARQDRTANQAKTAAEQVEARKGHRVLDEYPTEWNTAPYRLRMLRTPDGNPVDDDAIQGQPGVAVYVATSYSGTVRVDYFVDDPTALGYTIIENPHSVSGGGAVRSGPMSDEEKADRKELIANNKEWDAAETVRRDWVTQFLARKTTPKDAQAAIARALTVARWKIADALGHGSTTAKRFLGVEDTMTGDDLGGYLDAHPNRAVQVTLAIVLGGIEQNTSRQTWRTPTPDTAWYLRTLHDWGYPLTPVEQAAAMLQADGADDE